MRLALIAALAATALLGGCEHYVTPGGGVSLAGIGEKEVDIREAFTRQPAITFPARLAVVRVAASGYRSATNEGYGQGAFSVLMNRDIETDADFQRLGRLPQVAAAAPMTRLLIPSSLADTKALRQGAAQLRADALVMYTVDTKFRTETRTLGPLQMVALGMLTSRKASVSATCAVAIVDVRTGYIYGTAETTATETQASNRWDSQAAVEKARARAERKAFEQALDEVSHLWAGVLVERAAAMAAAR